MINFMCYLDAGFDIPMAFAIKAVSGMWRHVVW